MRWQQFTTGCCGVLLFGLWLSIHVPQVAAEERRPDNIPTVIVLKIAKNQSAIFAEERFVRELHLALSSFGVLAIEDPSDEFSRLPFTARLDLIRKLSKKYDAVATVWVERWTSNKMLLNLTAMSTGRALLKIVEVKSGPSAETELAFAVEALLGEAYLFSGDHTEKAVRQSVEKVKQRVSTGRRDGAPQTISALTLFGTLFGPLYPRTAGVKAGGGGSWTYGQQSGLFVSPGIRVLGGQKSRFHDGLISMWGIQADVVAGIYIQRHRLTVGPFLGVGVEWQRWDAFFQADKQKTSDLVGFRADLGVDGRLSLTDTLSIAMRLDMGATPNFLEFKRVSNEKIVMKTPILNGGIYIGLSYLLSP